MIITFTVNVASVETVHTFHGAVSVTIVWIIDYLQNLTHFV